MDIAGLIASFATGTYVVTRRARSSVRKGLAVEDPAPSTLSVVAAVAPAVGEDLERLPEGRRSNETKSFITSTLLYVGSNVDPYETDRVVIDGSTWELVTVETWVHPLVPTVLGYKCMVQK